MAFDGFDGMAALVADLHRMSATVQADAASLINRTAQAMRADVVARYPARTNTLRNRVTVDVVTPLRIKVRSKAPHAHLYEYGTVLRSLASTGAHRGRMPAAPTFVPAAQRARTQMTEQLIDLVRRQTVRGMTGSLEVRQS